MISFCALMRAGVAAPFFAGVVVVAEKDEGETWTAGPFLSLSALLLLHSFK